MLEKVTRFPDTAKNYDERTGFSRSRGPPSETFRDQRSIPSDIPASPCCFSDSSSRFSFVKYRPK